MEKIDHKSIYNENEIQSKYNKTIYDTIFIGGGPSTLSFISYLFKNNQIDKFIKERNILILEKNNFFGSGCLGKFGINSNTSAEGFVRLICQGTDSKDSKTKTNLSPDKANKQKDLTPMKMFQELFNTKIAQSLLSIGSKVAPLNLIGEFLQTTGNFILTILKSIFNKEIFIGESEVQLVKQLKNPTEYEIYFTKNKNTYRVKTKALVLASGAKQKFDQKTKQIILNYIEPEGFFNSDYVLQEQGFDKLYNYIKPKKKRKVVIIGGSHSGFSCAWILLNSFAKYNRTKITQKNNNFNDKVVKDFCTCTCTCNCFGIVKDLNWNSQNTEKLEIEIIIIYRDHVKVYYSTEREALNDGYNVFDPSKAVNKNSNVYPFIGIRGDAKELYRNISSGKEKRVTLVKCVNKEAIVEYIKGASAVIWAGGYTSNLIPFESDNLKLEFFQEEESTCEVSKELYILDKSKNPIKNLLGIGQGYATFSIEILANGRKGKADSVNLYNTHISKKLLKSLDEIYEANKKLYQSVSKVHDLRPHIIALPKKDSKEVINLVVKDANQLKKNLVITKKDTPVKAKEPIQTVIPVQINQQIQNHQKEIVNSEKKLNFISYNKNTEQQNDFRKKQPEKIIVESKDKFEDEKIYILKNQNITTTSILKNFNEKKDFNSVRKLSSRDASGELTKKIYNHVSASNIKEIMIDEKKSNLNKDVNTFNVSSFREKDQANKFKVINPQEKIQFQFINQSNSQITKENDFFNKNYYVKCNLPNLEQQKTNPSFPKINNTNNNTPLFSQSTKINKSSIDKEINKRYLDGNSQFILGSNFNGQSLYKSSLENYNNLMNKNNDKIDLRQSIGNYNQSSIIQQGIGKTTKNNLEKDNMIFSVSKSQVIPSISSNKFTTYNQNNGVYNNNRYQY